MSDKTKKTESKEPKPEKPVKTFDYREKSLEVEGPTRITRAVSEHARVIVMRGGKTERGWLLERDGSDVVVGLDSGEMRTAAPDGVHVITIEQDR